MSRGGGWSKIANQIEELPKPLQPFAWAFVFTVIAVLIGIGIATCHMTSYERAWERCRDWNEAVYLNQGRTPGFDGWSAIHARCDLEAENGLWDEALGE